jgi:hypothetical protein
VFLALHGNFVCDEANIQLPTYDFKMFLQNIKYLVPMRMQVEEISRFLQEMPESEGETVKKPQMEVKQL